MGAPKSNKYAEGRITGGRPSLFESVEGLQEKIDKYFEELPDSYEYRENGKTCTASCATISDLAHYLGFSSVGSMYEYGDREGFSHIIKKARSKISKEYDKLWQNRDCILIRRYRGFTGKEG